MKTLVDIYLRLVYFLAIEENIVRKNKADSKIYKPNEKCDKEHHRDSSNNKSGESQARLCKDSKGDNKNKSCHNRREKIERHPSKYSYISTEVFSGEVEVFHIRKLLSCKIGLIHILQKEIPICIGTDENRRDTENDKKRDKNSTDITKEKLFRTHGKPQFAVACEVLVNDNCNKGEGYDKSHDIGIEENTYLGYIPVKEVSIEENNVSENLLEIGDIGLHHSEKIGDKFFPLSGYKYIRFSFFARKIFLHLKKILLQLPYLSPVVLSPRFSCI